ncbi:MAG: DUF3455 domain-containing protein [Solirubrobacteraceae bacterium]|nr:DUF3455 domain-containing protein [Solirubrobacteraceae bacterium]
MNTFNHLRCAGVLAQAALAVASAAVAGVPFGDEPVPDTLRADAGVRALTTLAASGVQIYECRRSAADAPPAWAFVAPEAELFDRQGRRVGSHGAGPSWADDDGSRIVGSVQARAEAPRADALPWLLLATRSAAGPGRLSAVTQVQRIHTVGGLAPASGCTASTLTQQIRVPYRADYRLFVPA